MASRTGRRGNITDDKGDLDAIAQLVAFGVDLTRTQPIEFHIAALNSKAAMLIQIALKSAGIHSNIFHDEGDPDSGGRISPDNREFGPSWTVTAMIPNIPSLPELVRVQSKMNDIAQPFGGYSGGWGMMYNPKQSE